MFPYARFVSSTGPPSGRWFCFFVPKAVLACSLACLNAPASPLEEPLPDLIPFEQINLEKFEPAVGEQIRLAHHEARRDARNAEAVGKLGMIFQAYGKYELAEICYLRASALAPRSFRWLYYLGNVQGWLGKHRQAISNVREALKRDAGYTPARVRLAELLFESGQIEPSAKLYQEAIRQNPKLASAHLGLGRVRAARGEWAAAIEAYRRSCKLAENYVAAHYALGMVYRRTGNVSKAREHLERHQRVRQYPQPSEDPLLDAVKSLYAGGLSHLAKGSSLAQQGKLPEAAAAFESALKVNSRLVMAHVNLIAMYGQMGMPDKAEQHFRGAVALDPGWIEAYYNWGLFLYRQKRTAEAAEAFRKAVQINPSYADAHAQLGLLLDEAGRVEQAQRHYRLALEGNPAHRQALYLLGRSMIRTGPIEEAIQHLLETLKVEDSKTPLCLQALGFAYERAGDRERALYYTREAWRRAASLKMEELVTQLQKDLERLAGEARSR